MTATRQPPDDAGSAFLAQSRKQLSRCREKIAHCLAQLDDEQIWWRPHESHNSIANIVLHLCGNLRQWIVSSVGGAADVRDRPLEFSERGPIAGPVLLARLSQAIAEADAVLERISPKELLSPRRIQGFDETALSAVYDSVAHLHGHTQEIVFITRLQLGEAYQFHWRPTTKEQGAGT